MDNNDIDTFFKSSDITSVELAFPRANELKPSEYKEILLRTYRIKHCRESSSVLRDLISQKDVFDMVELPSKVIPQHTPDDYSVIWNSNVNSDWALDMINSELAWDISTGSSNIKIAIVDSDFDTGHGELNSQVVYNSGGSYIGNSCGERNHGTGVASVAAGHTNNNKGQSSIGYNCKLVVYGGYNVNDILNSALDGAHVINCSFRTLSQSAYDQNLVNAANNEGSIIVAAAGNRNGNNVTEYIYPASYDNVISVMAVDENKRYGCINCSNPPQSNQIYVQNDKVDVAAPGISMSAAQPTSIWNAAWNAANNGTCVYSDDYSGTLDGTSLSAPMVSGLIGLMLSVDPCLTTSEVEYILENTGEDVYNLPVNSYFNNTYGTEVPLIDAYAALQAVQDYPQVISDNAVITGPALVCNNVNAAFTLSNVPEGMGISWAKSSNLSILSGQGTSSVTVKSANGLVNGVAWVRPTLSNDCGNAELDAFDFWLGSPEPAHNSTVYLIGYYGQNPITLASNGAYDFQISNTAGATSYYWQLPVGFSFVGSVSTNATASLWTPNQNGQYILRVHPENACGTNGTGNETLTINIIGGSGGGPGDPNCPDPPCEIPPGARVVTGGQTVIPPTNLDARAMAYHPNTGLVLKGFLPNAKVTVIDAVGKYMAEYCYNNNPIYMEGLAQGVYIAVAADERKVLKERILIQ